jgi:hypothetical protein
LPPRGAELAIDEVMESATNEASRYKLRLRPGGCPVGIALALSWLWQDLNPQTRGLMHKMQFGDLLTYAGGARRVSAGLSCAAGCPVRARIARRMRAADSGEAIGAILLAGGYRAVARTKHLRFVADLVARPSSFYPPGRNGGSSRNVPSSAGPSRWRLSQESLKGELASSGPVQCPHRRAGMRKP